MLKLSNIKKDYVAGDMIVHALKGISINFREHEFVSILGPSGCGKTTLLNIIGGLDHYTSGDLIIDEVSTKNYNDRDWDIYRNHKIGFVFQAYNLIPHQTILENVELALTISGVSKEERIKKAKETLDKVGLKGLYNKKPNQLSGGQCQRVAIARSLVNDPEILLADEPTGALDTVTSVQIMDLIKEIAKDTLVIMVTHNPELAEKYSTRIVKLIDGEVLSDSNPFDDTKEDHAPKPVRKSKSKLSIWQAFRLSSRNLISKFKRTLMVCIAGSIGIIGVATVLSVSNGVKSYISDMQNDMLSGNPIKITESAMDLTSLMNSASTTVKKDAIEAGKKEDGTIDVNLVLEYLVRQSKSLTSAVVSNDITQNYIDYVNQMPKEYYNVIDEDYGINLMNNIYTDINLDNIGTKNYSLSAIVGLYTAMLQNSEYTQYSNLIGFYTNNLYKAIDNEEFVLSQYDFVLDEANTPQHFPTKANEIMIVLDSNEEISDLLLAQLGYYKQDEFMNILKKATDNDSYDSNMSKYNFKVSEVMSKKMYFYTNDEIYTKSNTSTPLDDTIPFKYNASIDNGGYELTITAILKPKEGMNYGCLSTGIYYSEALVDKMLETSLNSEIVTYLNDEKLDGFNGMVLTNNGMSIPSGTLISYPLHFFSEGVEYNVTSYLGSTNKMSEMMGAMTGQSMPQQVTLTKRQLGGENIANSLTIYPKDFELKNSVTNYLNKWNEDGDITVNGVVLTKDDRSDITYTDTLSIIIAMIDSMITIITSALVAFTSLSLVVSTVMISIITYVSVIERVKEIGVIRSLGGRKKDVSRLFNAETMIIGFSSGLIGILLTYGISAIINLIVNSLSGIGAIAILPIPTAIIMILISVLLTSISGVMPAKLAAKKDPVEALRSE